MFKLLLKLQLKQNFNSLKACKNKKSLILPSIFLAISLIIIILSLNVTASSFERLKFGEQYLAFVYFAMLIIFTIFNCSKIITKMYLSKDDVNLFKLPVKISSIFLSKLAFILINQLVLMFAFTIFTIGVYGFHAEMGVSYYLLMIVNMLIVCFLSLALAGVISVPVMMIISFVKSKNKLKLLLISLCVIIFFVGYTLVINMFVEILEIASGKYFLGAEAVQKIKSAFEIFIVSNALTDVILLRNVGLNISLFLLAIIIFSLASYKLTSKAYFNIHQSELSTTSTKQISHQKINSTKKALVLLEFKNIFRQTAISFHFIVTSFTMPIMVYQTARIVASSASDMVGEKVVFGVCVLTLIMFLVLSNSQSSSAISRFNKTNGLLNSLPINKFSLILAKSFVYSVLTIVPFVCSISVLFLAGLINFLSLEVLLINLVPYICVCNVVQILDDYKYSKNNLTISSESLSNTFIHIALGVFYALISGIICIAVPYLTAFNGGVIIAFSMVTLIALILKGIKIKILSRGLV